MSSEYRREYLTRLPLPLAQLYSRAHNAKAARDRHDNTFYLFEALVKLATAPLAAVYLDEVERGAARVPALDRALACLSSPSLGQWVAILRGAARHFGTRPDASSHPLGHLQGQLDIQRKDLPGLLALYRRIKNGPDGAAAGDTHCSLMQVLDALVPYRNGVFGHGAGRFESFYADEMGPLLFPAANELMADGTLEILGPRGSRLVQVADLRVLDEGRVEVGLRDLVGDKGERTAPLLLDRDQALALVPNRVALLWPGRAVPLRLDPLLAFREGELTDEVLFLNRDRNGRQVEYLSYTTGKTERDATMASDLAKLLSRVTGRPVSEDQVRELAERSVAETPSVEGLFGPSPLVGRARGDYEVLAEIGRGGMGVVYLARQLSLGRLVALKMLPADLAGDAVALARFRREMRVLAQCEHPNIVKVLASGTMPDGELFYAMEYVPGCDLEQVWKELSGSERPGDVSTLGGSTWAKAVLTASRKKREQVERKPSEPSATLAEAPIPRLPLPPLPAMPSAPDDPGGYVRRVAALIRDAALALQAVHDQQVVHRDVKPANLMLTPDGSRIVLMDFGLAKGQSLSLTASRAGGLLGTLRYAAPEQLASTRVKVGPSADVRGLGVTLWEMLTRRRLFEEAEDEVSLAAKVLGDEVPALRSVEPSFDRDLEAIVMRACERRAADRIATPGKLAEYLQMFLDGKALPIRPPTTGEILFRSIREHKPLVGTALAALGVIVATVSLAFVFITRSRDSALEANALLEEQLYNTRITVAERELSNNQDFDLAGRLLESCSKPLRGWEWNYLRRLLDSRQAPLSGHKRGLWMAVFSPDGHQAATASIDGTVKIWDVASSRSLSTFEGHSAAPFGGAAAARMLSSLGLPNVPVMCLAYSPDGRRIASGSFQPNLFNLRQSHGVVIIWDVATKREVLKFQDQLGVVLSLDYRPDGRQIASSSINPDNTFVVWDAQTGSVVKVMRGHTSQIHRLRYSPDGRLLASASTDGTVKLWDAGSLDLVRTIKAHPAPVIDVSFSSDGRRFATASEDGTLRVWDTGTGTRIAILRGHNGSTLGVTFSPDGSRIASAGFDKTVRLWHAKTFKEMITLRGHRDTVWSVAFSPDGRRLLSASFDNDARVWDASPPLDPAGAGTATLAGHQERVNGVSYSADGRILASSSWDQTVRLWDARTGAVLQTLKGHEGAVWGVAISPDGQRVASASWDHTVKVWQTATGKELLTFTGHTAPVHSLAFSPDGRRIVSAGFDGQVKIWDASTGTVTANCEGFIFPVLAVAFSHDGRHIASGGTDRLIKLWDANTGQPLQTIKKHEAVVHGLAFSADGKHLASASWDKTAIIWKLDTAGKVALGDRETRILTNHGDRVTSLAFSADGASLATASEDKTVRIWDVRDGRELMSYLDRGCIWSVAIRPDGRQIAGGCWSDSGWLKTWPLRLEPPESGVGNAAATAAR